MRLSSRSPRSVRICQCNATWGSFYPSWSARLSWIVRAGIAITEPRNTPGGWSGAEELHRPVSSGPQDKQRESKSPINPYRFMELLFGR